MNIYHSSDSPSPGEETVQIPESIPVTSRIEIALKSNPQNGFMWYLDGNSSIVSFLDQQIEPLPRYRGSIQHFFFDVVSTGDDDIRFVYKRSWEKFPYAIKHIVVSCGKQ
jgi:predicted secreted protein